MPKSTVQKTSSEINDLDGSTRTITQYSASIPKQLAEFFSLDSKISEERTLNTVLNDSSLTVLEGLHLRRICYVGFIRGPNTGARLKEWFRLLF